MLSIVLSSGRAVVARRYVAVSSGPTSTLMTLSSSICAASRKRRQTHAQPSPNKRPAWFT